MTRWRPETTPNFSLQEMCCKCGKCGGSCEMKQHHMEKLQAMRDKNGPMTVTSGYRCPQHPDEIKKAVPGSHGQGTATDIRVDGGGERFKLVDTALMMGMQGIGIASTFIHVDSGHTEVPRPAIWKY